MSHIVSIQTEVRDPVAIRSACDRLRLPEPVFGETKLFSSSATGWAMQLPEWRYPVVADVITAAFRDRHWGDLIAMGRLKSLLQPPARPLRSGCAPQWQRDYSAGLWESWCQCLRPCPKIVSEAMRASCRRAGLRALVASFWGFAGEVSLRQASYFRCLPHLWLL